MASATKPGHFGVWEAWKQVRSFQLSILYLLASSSFLVALTLKVPCPLFPEGAISNKEAWTNRASIICLVRVASLQVLGERLNFLTVF